MGFQKEEIVRKWRTFLMWNGARSLNFGVTLGRNTRITLTMGTLLLLSLRMKLTSGMDCLVKEVEIRNGIEMN